MANELRVLLLLGHVIFRKVLQKRFYNHLIQLVVIMHLAESHQLNKSYQQLIYQLSQEFVVSFPQLYTNRHCVQVVHSVFHIADTVHDFGPLSN